MLYSFILKYQFSFFIKAEDCLMQTVTDVYSNSVKYTTDYTNEYFNANMNGYLARIDSILTEMVQGTKTATCM